MALRSSTPSNPIAATDRLYDRVPDAQPWLIRIGHRAVHKSLGIKINRSDRTP